MPPALQMHSHLVPPPPTFGALAGALPIRDRDHDANAASFRSRQSQDFSLPYRRCLPIRISQSQLPQQVPATQIPLPPTEYRLRRKTPNGTVDAGYDGSPGPLSSGPPPLKHMIIAASVAGFDPLATTDSSSHQPGEAWPGCMLAPEYARDAAVRVNRLPASPWPSNAQRLTPHLGSLQTPPSNHPTGAPGIRCEPPHSGLNIYQPVLRANEHNVRAVCPPPLPMNGHLPIGHVPWQQGPLPWDCRTPEHSQAHAWSYRPPYENSTGQPVLCHLAEQISPGSLDCMRSPGGVHHVAEPTAADSLSRDKILPPSAPAPYMRRVPGRVSQSGFKEKTLAHAHQCYLDLLAFLQANGRANAPKSSSGAGTTHGLPAYPKPRRVGPGLLQLPRASGPVGGGGATLLGNGIIDGQSSADLFMRGLAGQHGPYLHRLPMSGSRQLNETNEKQYTAQGSSTPLMSTSSIIRATPLNNAVSSLEVLTSLCEQCGWKWLDGMLLGGCLYYGLEQYEVALTWFSRILEIDSR